jgi:hypothetical protein
VPAQSLGDNVGQWDFALLAAFGWRDDRFVVGEELDLLPYVQDLLVEVDVFDSDAESFALTQTAAGADEHHGRISRRMGVDDGEDALVRPRPDTDLRNLRGAY